jgi:hypothetical protein
MFITMSAFLITVLVASSFTPDKLIDRVPTNGAYVDIKNAACGLDMLKDYGSVKVPGCWGHFFVFPQKWSQTFQLDMTLHRLGSDLSWSGDKDVKIKILWQGAMKYIDVPKEEVKWELIAEDTVVRTGNFATNKVDSSSIVTFKSSSIIYEAYFFQVIFVDTNTNPDALAFLSNVSFLIHYEAAGWAQYELGFKTAFLVISIAVAIVYRLLLSSVKRRLRSYEQNQILILSVGVIFYNNPLFWLEYVLPRHFFAWADTVFQMTFIALLLNYWLVTFDGMRQDPPFAFKKFYLPKMILVGIYWAVGVAAYLGIQGKEWSDPLFNWYQDRSLTTFALAYTILAGLMYLGYLFYLLAMGLTQDTSLTNRQKVTFAFHAAVVLMVLIGSFVGSATSSMASRPSDYIYFFAVFNGYVWCLVYMYSPTSSENITMEARDMVRVQGDTDYGGSIVPSALDVQIIEKEKAGSKNLRSRTNSGKTPTAGVVSANPGALNVQTVSGGRGLLSKSPAAKGHTQSMGV